MLLLLLLLTLPLLRGDDACCCPWECLRGWRTKPLDKEREREARTTRSKAPAEGPSRGRTMSVVLLQSVGWGWVKEGWKLSGYMAGQRTKEAPKTTRTTDGKSMSSMSWHSCDAHYTNQSAMAHASR